MAVKAPYGPTSVFDRSNTFPPSNESPWSMSSMSQSKPNALNGSLYSPTRNSSFLSPVPQGDEMPTTPLDITAPSPSTSESSTVFTDLDGEEEPRSAQPGEEKPGAIQVDRSIHALKSPSANLKINTAPLSPPKPDEEEPPQSVIHIPSGFGRFVPPGSIHRTSSRLSQSHLAHRSHRSQSQSSGTVSLPLEPKQAPATQPSLDRPAAFFRDPDTPEPSSAVSAAPSQALSFAPSLAPSAVPSLAPSAAPSNTESTAPSESTLRAEQERGRGDPERQSNNGQMPLSPMSSVTDLESLKDWASTPRAQTRQDLLSLSRPGSSLASELRASDFLDHANSRQGIREGDDDDQRSDRFPTDTPVDGLDQGPWEMGFRVKSEKSIEALELALSECWMLCNTLANLSHLHRERIFTNNSGKDDKQEQAWKSCWKLCQTLYETKDNSGVAATKSTLALCRDFCQALFEIRVRSNEAADSVLRVSFELNNHLFNTHDRTLPDSFRERTLEFYVALCHRLMKQQSKMGAETDTLLRACWTLAEMLFSLRQSKRLHGKADQDLLGQAMQACWDLCDLFRAGWTQVRPDRGSSRSAPATFSQAFQTAKKAGHIEDSSSQKIMPETPTTIFDDTATVSPDDAPAPTISVMGSRHPQSAKSVSSAPAAVLPRPNTTQRISRSSNYSRSQDRWGSINGALLEEEEPSQPTSAVSQNSFASSQNSLTSSHVSLVSSLASSQHTIRTPSEDPSLTMLKALFVRAAVATGRGFSPDPRSTKRDPTYTSLPLFARSLPENAFGPQKWQRELLEHYKKTVAQDATFKNFGNSSTAIGIGIDPEKGSEDIAGILKGLVENTTGWGWLRDLFRYGYGAGIDEVLAKPTKSRASSRGTSQASRNEESTLTNGVSRSNSNGNGIHSVAGVGSVNGTGHDGRRVSPPRR